MKKPLQDQVRAARGFTLIEIMVVIAIIIVLAGMVVSGVGWYKRKAAENKTKVLVASVERALEEYRSDNSTFPVVNDPNEGSTSEVYMALFGDSDGDGQANSGETVYLSILDPNLTGNKLNVEKNGGAYVIVDSWFAPLRYQSPGDMNPDFDLWSMGPDGQGGPTGASDKQRDDIKNW
ncbi:MAG: type II secretion system protein GspG [Akkermansiaceae bacterium]